MKGLVGSQFENGDPHRLAEAVNHPPESGYSDCHTGSTHSPHSLVITISLIVCVSGGVCMFFHVCLCIGVAEFHLSVLK